MSKKFLCSAPWQGLFVNPDGSFRICCAGDDIGNLNTQTLDEVLASPILTKLQDDMLNQGYSDYCHTCVELEAVSGKSLREQFKTDLTVVDTTEYNPTNIDVRWRNTCQLRCGYCHSSWSSTYAAWAGDTTKYNTRDWQTELLAFLRKADPDTRYHFVAMLGGEPLLLKENIELADIIAPDTLICILTNLALPKLDTNPVYKKLINRNMSWFVSMENIGNKLEYTRRNAKWEVVDANYRKVLREHTPGSAIRCHMTYCILSAFTLCETFDWCYSVETDHNEHALAILTGPGEFNVLSYPREIKELAIKEIDTTMTKHAGYLVPGQTDFLTSVRATLMGCLDTYNIADIKRFKEYVDESDKTMAPISFASEWPEVAAILEKYW